MELTLKRFRAALALKGWFVEDFCTYYKKKHRRPLAKRSIYRAIREPKFSRDLREYLTAWTNKELGQESDLIRRAA